MFEYKNYIQQHSESKGFVMTTYKNLSTTLGKKYATELSAFSASKKDDTNADGKITGEFYTYAPKDMQLQVDWSHAKLPVNCQKDFEKKHSITV
jgi:hypothetical protein